MRGRFDANKLAELASLLNVPPDSLPPLTPGWADASDLAELRAGGAGWDVDRPTGAFSFPERDGGGRLVGFSLRAVDGRKGAGAASAGCRRGLVVPANLRELVRAAATNTTDSTIQDSTDPKSKPEAAPRDADDDVAPILIVEGASDVAACAAMGVRAVGRPSNSAGADDLGRLLDGEHVLVIGENDAKPTGAWPGRDGAKSVAAKLAAIRREAVQ